MQLQELIPENCLLVGFEAQDKWDAIERMVEHLVGIGRLGTEVRSEHLDAVLARERSSPTGMEHGLAIPHAAVDDLEEVVACLAIAPGEGINFDSVDGSRTHFVTLLLIPRSQKLLHIRTLGSIARILGTERVREALLVAASAGEAWHALEENA